nr:hypothetical protein [Tanacetum cinerariifolium]
LKDLKFSLLDQLEGLKDAPVDVIMAALYLKSDTGGDAPQYIRDLRPSSSQLSIPVSDGIPVSVPAVVPQGLAVLLVDGATQTDPDECICNIHGTACGITASVPYIREKGVSPWLDLIIVLWAQRTWGSSSTQ